MAAKEIKEKTKGLNLKLCRTERIVLLSGNISKRIINAPLEILASSPAVSTAQRTYYRCRNITGKRLSSREEGICLAQQSSK